ncbi:hypothetical protein QBC47DRAFT_196379 [Echria macrotheca]|uniref:Uncharacterized protein n=1 Tax=Echria macrotheca TaxID=438768 RepID=A0AAJ0F6K4_9PEZI|nr:hypothetical protein QBC47DRAFT_196379 [Echria macrotheca]
MCDVRLTTELNGSSRSIAHDIALPASEAQGTYLGIRRAYLPHMPDRVLTTHTHSLPLPYTHTHAALRVSLGCGYAGHTQTDNQAKQSKHLDHLYQISPPPFQHTLHTTPPTTKTTPVKMSSYSFSMPTSRTYGQEIVQSRQALHQQQPAHQQQRNRSSSISSRSSTSSSSRLSLLKERLHSSTSSKDQKKHLSTDKIMRSQIRMGI